MDHGASSYRRYLDGDDNGLAEIIRLYNSGLTLFINSFVNNLSAADELSEDTFVKIGLKKPRFSGKSSFKTWLYAIGRNVAIDYIKKSRRHPHISIDECTKQADEEALESRLFREERKNILHKAMRTLKPEYRQVLWLTYFEGMSAKETAKVMRKSVHSIENLLSRARRSLKSELNQEGFDDENL